VAEGAHFCMLRPASMACSAALSSALRSCFPAYYCTDAMVSWLLLLLPAWFAADAAAAAAAAEIYSNSVCASARLPCQLINASAVPLQGTRRVSPRPTSPACKCSSPPTEGGCIGTEEGPRRLEQREDRQ